MSDRLQDEADRVFAAISDRLKAAEWSGMTGKEAAALVDRVAELEGQAYRLRNTLDVRDGQLGRSRQFVAELQGRVDDLTGQVAGRDATIQRVRDLHREWVLYDEDACTHEDEDHDVRTIAGVGNVCVDALKKSLCRECGTDDGEFQSRHCVEDHAGTPCWPCPTIVAIDGDPADTGDGPSEPHDPRHRRLMARLRDLVTDLRQRDEDLLAARDRIQNHDRALGHERSAHEVRTVADKLDQILSSLDGDPADDGSQTDG